MTWIVQIIQLIGFLRIVVWHMSVHSLARGHVIRVCEVVCDGLDLHVYAALITHSLLHIYFLYIKQYSTNKKQ